MADIKVIGEEDVTLEDDYGSGIDFMVNQYKSHQLEKKNSSIKYVERCGSILKKNSYQEDCKGDYQSNESYIIAIEQAKIYELGEGGPKQILKGVNMNKLAYQ